MPRSIDDQPGLLPGEEAPDESLLRDLRADLGIELAWALDGLNADAKGVPVVSVAWSRVADILDHHGDDAHPVVTIDWIRGYVAVEVTVYAWRRWNRDESWPTGQPTRYRDVPGVGTVEEIRYHLATIRARSPGGWAGSLSFDGGLQISEPRGGV